MRRGAAIFTVTAAIALTGCGSMPAADDTAERTIEDDGRFIAVTQCSSCHAIGRVGRSPNVNAPPLRRVLSNYNPRTLEADFADGMRVGHTEMPRIRLAEYDAEALIAYLQSIRD